LEAAQIATLYDARGAMEVDIRGDKRGLGIEKRRKKSFLAQEALVLLAQLSHNLRLCGSSAGFWEGLRPRSWEWSD
jgi:hypothetical protein